MKRSELMFNVLLVFVDFAMIVVAGMLAYSLRFSDRLSHLRPIVFDLPFSSFMEIVFIVSPFFVVSFALLGLYSNSGIRKIIKEIAQVVIGISAVFMLLIFVTFMQREMFSSRFIFFAGWFFAIFSVITGRLFVRLIQIWAADKLKFGFHRLVLLGENTIVKTVQKEIRENKALGYKI